MIPAGVLFIDKQPGMTSFSSLGSIKRRISKKVGHTGTLDKFARGLLVVLVGPFTKLNPFFTSLDKQYQAVFRFGLETETLDPEGAVTAEGPVPELEQVLEACTAFTGTQMQVPPIYSAVHVNGKRAYQQARKGENVDIPAREITITSMVVDAWEPPFLRVTIDCTKGTYIRSLARDMGKYMGSCGYVTELTRTRVGQFKLSDAKTADETTTSDLMYGKELFSALGDYSIAVINESYTQSILNGILPKRAWIDELEASKQAEHCVLYNHQGMLLGLANIEKDRNNGIQFRSYTFVVPTGSIS
jgi:tRNA pseudouridine55 synthase